MRGNLHFSSQPLEDETPETSGCIELLGMQKLIQFCKRFPVPEQGLDITGHFPGSEEERGKSL